MLHPIIQRKLAEIIEARREVRLKRGLALVAATATILVLLAMWRGAGGLTMSQVSLGLFFLVVGGGLAANWWSRRERLNPQAMAREIEARHPELDALLRTAVEVEPGATGLSYLQEQVVHEAAAAAARQMWADDLAGTALKRARFAHGTTLAVFLLVFLSFVFQGPRLFRQAAQQAVAAAKAEQPEQPSEFEIAVTPGDAEVEKGARLIVEARFAKDVPADAAIVVSDAAGGESRRIPMRLTVDQQVFGGMIAKIERDSRYRVEFGDCKSPDYQITTYIHPELERADATITPPDYTGLPVKEIKNTLKVSALEGSQVAFRFKVNKPVAEAELFGEDKTIIPLKPSAADPTVLEAAMKPEKTQKYRLHLVDDKERSNKQPPWLTVNVTANQLPKIEIAFPKRDVQVSAIQELPVEAKVWDDLGVRKAGAIFNLAGRSKEIMLSTAPLPAAKKHDVKARYDLEHEAAEPRQLVSYYLWAEDQGPKGEVRRAMSDMFFAEVRHFEDIFREAEAPPSEPGKPQQQSEGDKLVELQKQVVNATWRLIRDTNAGRAMEAAAPDIGVVRQSEEKALEQVKAAMEKAEDVEIKNALTEAWKSMKDAIGPLGQAEAEKTRGPLNQALVHEQAALEWLYRTASREHQVMRRNPNQKGGGGQQANQQQLMNLELKQKEQRYEEEKQAAEEQSAEQKENLMVLNRLKELARRQEALAEKMKELEKQIEAAKTEEEKQELANQLKRLQDEQEQLLRDVDDLKEKMETSENQALMAEAKQELEKTRDQVLDAAEQIKEQQLAQAANSATRAQRQLEEMQEDFRKKTSRKFSDEMRQMKQQAREAAEQQKKIAETLENQKSNEQPGDKSNSIERSLDGAQTARAIEQQQERVAQLMENMRQVSEQAENAEPLLSQSLYDAVRKAHTSGVTENLEEARQYSRFGERALAQDAERKATKAVEDLQKGVEKAAESVLGSETEALRMARAELDSLIKGLKDQEGEGEDGDKGKSGEEDKSQQAQADSGQKPGEPSKEGRGQQPGEQAEGEGKAGQESKDARTAKAQNGQPSPEGTGGEKAEQGAKPGEQPGKGEAGKDAQMAEGKSGEQGQQPGQQQGQGGQPGKPGEQPQMAQGKEGQGSQEGQGNQPSQQGKGGEAGESQQASSSQGQPQQPGQNQNGQPGEGEPGQRGQDGSASQSTGRGLRQVAMNDARDVGDRRPDGNERNAGGGGGDEGGFFFNEADQIEDTSPITGNQFEQWSDRLRNVEELLNQPELRNEAARVLDNARAIRQDYRRNDQAPQSSYVKMRIIEPLTELRDRVAEELAKRGDGNLLAPVDRDPVPQQFRELVRRYYQELGEGK